VENKSLLERNKHLQSTSNSATQVMERLADRESCIHELRKTIADNDTTNKSFNDNLSFLKAENDAL